MKVVAVSQRVDVLAERGETRDALDQRLVDFLLAGGCLPPVGGHVRTRHRLSGRSVAEVNSYHGLALADCPEDFEVLARSEDGEIEAIRHLRLPWEGWMWHPEREPVFAAHDLARLKALFGE